MKKYEKAEMEIVEFDAVDILTTSNEIIKICTGADYESVPTEEADGCIWGD